MHIHHDNTLTQTFSLLTFTYSARPAPRPAMTAIARAAARWAAMPRHCCLPMDG